MSVLALSTLLVTADRQPSIFAPAYAAGNTADAVRIDADPSGNTATSLGPIETCREAATGDTFDVDVVIENVTDILAFKSVFTYDKTKLEVVDVDIEFLLDSSPASDLLNTSSAVPDDDGFYGLRALDFTKDPQGAESGSGVLGRVTLRAIDSGLSTVFLSIPKISPGLVDFERDPLEPADRLGTWLGEVSAARIAIDEECPGGVTAPPPTPPSLVQTGVQTPTAGETPTGDGTPTTNGTPTGDVTPAPGGPGEPAAEGNTAEAISIDADPADNTATSLGTIEFCQEVEAGEIFDVDIVIEDVTDLLAFSVTLSYDGTKIRVVGESAGFFLISNQGSSLFDNSEGVPDENGLYEIFLLDQAQDPATAESGSGVLARISLEALGRGLTTLSVGIPNVSPNLTDVDGRPLQPTDEFGVWLGDVFDAQVATGEPCPETPPQPRTTPSPDATATPTVSGDEEEDGDDGMTVFWIIVGSLAGVAALLAALFAWLRLRGRTL